MERGPLKYQDIRLRYLKQMRGFLGLFLALGRISLKMAFIANNALSQ